MSKNHRNAPHFLKAVFAGLTTALLLSACDGVGNGNQLKSLRIIPNISAIGGGPSLVDAQTIFTDATAFECVRKQIALIGQFSKNDDSIGTLTFRAQWTSSNPAVVRVSNLNDEPSPTDPNAFFPPGVLTPVSPGTATVTANFLDLTTSIVVTVKAITDLSITPVDARLATGSNQVYTLSALVDGVSNIISPLNNAVLSVLDESANVVALDNLTTDTNDLRARNPGGPINVQYSLPACGRTVSTSVRVADPVALVLQHQEGFNGPLVVGTSEILTAFADFGDGPEQNLSASATYTLVDSTASTRVSLIPSAGGGGLTALVAGDPAAVRATCCLADRNGDLDNIDPGEAASFTSNDLLITPVAGTLTSFTISPLDASIVQLGTQAYSVLGSFDNGARLQPILAEFVSSDMTLVTFPANGSTARSEIAVTAPTTVTITANTDNSVPNGTAPPVTTTLTVTPLPASP